MAPFKPPEIKDPTRIADALKLLAGERARQSRSLIETVAQAVFEAEASGEVTEPSATWMAYTGLSESQTRGFGWLDAIHPDDRPELMRLRQAAMRAQSDLTAEFRLLRADGSWCWSSVRAVPVFEGDRIVRWTGMMIDVSARRETEAQLAEAQEDYYYAVELNPQMRWIAGPDGQMLSINDRWCEFLGMPREQVLTSKVSDVAHPDDAEGLLTAYQHSLKTGLPLAVRFRVRTASGEYRWTRVDAKPRRDAQGRIVKWYGFTEDIHDSVLAEEEVRAAEERYRLAVQATNDVIWDIDIPTGIVRWSGALEERFGHRLEGDRACKRWWIRHIHPDDRGRIVPRASDSLAGLGPDRWTNEYRFLRADGSYAHVLDRGQRISGPDGKPVRVIGALLDLTDKRRADVAMLVSEERFRLAVAASGLGISDYDVRADTLHWSRELRAILGVGDDEPASQKSVQQQIHPEDRPGAADQVLRSRSGDFSHQYRGVRRIYRRSDNALRWVATQGQPIYDASGNLMRIIVTAKDVTDEKSAQDRLRWTATHDAVTGLSNRAAFQEALDSTIAVATAEQQKFALFLVDLDDFKRINDSLGHHSGDLVLRTIGGRISEIQPENAVLARFGGDEFALLIPCADRAQASAVAEAMLANLRHPFSIDGRGVDLRASIGIALFPDHGRTQHEILKSADIALYAAKDVCRGMARTYEPAMRAAIETHTTMLTQARSIVDNAWAQPFYQPKIALGSGRMQGCEALFRWRHPQGKVQSPAAIAGAFDDLELAAVLGETMVEAVLGDVRRWIDAGMDVGRIAINASAAEFHQPAYAERLLERMATHCVPPRMLELEITETALLDDRDDQVLHALQTLRAAGMTIALDDFGTGFASLAHLRNFPVDTIKIDRSFVSGIDAAEGATGNRAIVEAVLRLGEALGITTVAEGVETDAQAAFLRSRGCTLAQGYLYARPLPADALPRFLSKRGSERRTI